MSTTQDRAPKVGETTICGRRIAGVYGKEGDKYLVSTDTWIAFWITATDDYSWGVINQQILWGEDLPPDDVGDYDLCGTHNGVYVDVMCDHYGKWKFMYDGKLIEGGFDSRDSCKQACIAWVGEYR